MPEGVWFVHSGVNASMFLPDNLDVTSEGVLGDEARVSLLLLGLLVGLSCCSSPQSLQAVVPQISSL